LIRDQAGRLAFGETLLDAARTYLDLRWARCAGRDGNVHRGRPREGYLPMISHLGAMIAVVNGTLMARRFKGVTGTVGAACIGEGATSTGAFHEAVNQAAVEKLPLVLSSRTIITRTRRRVRGSSPVDRSSTALMAMAWKGIRLTGRIWSLA
jgi:pyruvate dehydrogenase E1 component alpha subunit/2-oxoisovalerate dehydrogenase E1 component alpha subunit